MDKVFATVLGVFAFGLLFPCIMWMRDTWGGWEGFWWLLMVLLNLNSIRIAINIFLEDENGRQDEEDSASR